MARKRQTPAVSVEPTSLIDALDAVGTLDPHTSSPGVKGPVGAEEGEQNFLAAADSPPTVPPYAPTCENCKHYKASTQVEGQGECRRYPPVVVSPSPVLTSGGCRGIFPITLATFLCGEYIVASAPSRSA